MTSTSPLPPVAELKAQARRLRATLEGTGQAVGHGRSLELLAHQMGFRDWNTLRAAADRPGDGFRLSVGARVTGTYLGQAFAGEVLAVEQLPARDLVRVTVHFDEPVDVVRFESFSALRQRVTCLVDRNGVSPRRTSDGPPHMRLAT